ncbi:UNVERIFIED_CONTAM: hypothetical protein GTU68_027701, partial [Idotea baltica]|nr:hypothetical protein [Idotea baltica]
MSGFDQFESVRVEIEGETLFARIGGDGLPLVLLHGFPQTHLMWEGVVERLSQRRTVIAFDLPGYGQSDPPASVDFSSKRAVSAKILAGLSKLGAKQFDLAGHDRGGRVAYRMAMDHPDRVARLAVLDILPTAEYWAKMDHAFAMKIYHWAFLAQPEPLPERLIGGAPDYYIDYTLASWTASKSLAAFAPHALEAYRENARNPRLLRAMCDDYRAGESTDVDHDKADMAAGKKITCPTLAVWGASGI